MTARSLVPAGILLITYLPAADAEQELHHVRLLLLGELLDVLKGTHLGCCCWSVKKVRRDEEVGRRRRQRQRGSRRKKKARMNCPFPLPCRCLRIVGFWDVDAPVYDLAWEVSMGSVEEGWARFRSRKEGPQPERQAGQNEISGGFAKLRAGLWANFLALESYSAWWLGLAPRA